MPLRSLALCLICVGSLLLGAGSPTHADIPGAEDPKAPTNHDYLRSMFAMNKRLLIDDGYNAVGTRDPKWDATVPRVLEALASDLAYADVLAIYRVRPPADVAEQIKLSKSAISLGCNDPLLLYAHAWYLGRTDDSDNRGADAAAAADVRAQVKAALRRSADGFVADGKYHPLLTMLACQRLIKHLDDVADAESVERYRKLVAQQMRRVMSGDVRKDERRCLLTPIGDVAAFTLRLDELGQVLDQLKQDPKAEPWLLSVTAGWYHIQEAWKARGDSSADKVTPEGWEGFRDHLASAREHLVKAYEMQPDYPEAA